MNERRSEPEKNEMEIDLGQFLKLVWHWVWLVILIGVLCMILAFGGTKLFIAPKYASQVSYMVTYRTNSSSITGSEANNSLTYSKNLISNFIVLLQQNKYYEALSEVSARNGVTVSAEELSKMISYQTATDTSQITVRVESTDPNVAYQVALAVETLQADYIRTNYPNFDETTTDLGVINTVTMATAPFSPNTLMNTAIGGVIGMLLVVGVLLIVFLTDTRIKSKEELENRLNLPVLGEIPDADALGAYGGYGYGYGYGSHRERHICMQSDTQNDQEREENENG